MDMGHLSTKSMLARAVILVALVVVESLWLEGSELARSMLDGAQLMIARSAGLALGARRLREHRQGQRDPAAGWRRRGD